MVQESTHSVRILCFNQSRVRRSFGDVAILPSLRNKVISTQSLRQTPIRESSPYRSNGISANFINLKPSHQPADAILARYASARQHMPRGFSAISRLATRLDKETRRSNIRNVSVVGAVQMGKGIAQICALSGLDVAINDLIRNVSTRGSRILAYRSARRPNVASSAPALSITQCLASHPPWRDTILKTAIS